MVTVVLKQSCKIDWVRNQACLLNLGLSHGVKDGLEARPENSVFFQPQCLGRHIKLMVG